MLNKFFIRKLFCNSGVSGINLNINLNIIHSELYTICLELYKFFVEKFKRQLFLSTSYSKLLIWVSHRLVFSGFTGASLSCRDYVHFCCIGQQSELERSKQRTDLWLKNSNSQTLATFSLGLFRSVRVFGQYSVLVSNKDSFSSLRDPVTFSK